jgi:hypothetical protein
LPPPGRRRPERELFFHARASPAAAHACGRRRSNNTPLSLFNRKEFSTMSISTYENASAVFPFADKPAALVLIAVLVALVTLFVLIASFVHEKHSYSLPDDDAELHKLKR